MDPDLVFVVDLAQALAFRAMDPAAETVERVAFPGDWRLAMCLGGLVRSAPWRQAISLPSAQAEVQARLRGVLGSFGGGLR